MNETYAASAEELCAERRRALRLAFAMLAVFGMTACGMRGDPQPPPNAERRVPRQYPAQ